ncbi:MAG: ABC transporter ATP-binding protein [Sedimentisphaerales bacterium]|nr:ABC transporter ATP-binding protein [Sedimentisphaerales bacterium]
MNEYVIEIQALSRRFGKKYALQDIDVKVPRGIVLGLVGENGAGKTTLIKHLLGLLKAQTGTVRVFDKNPVEDPVGVLGRIGYLSENREMPQWMSINEYIRYTKAFYPGWDMEYEKELISNFELDRTQLIKHLSRGQKAKVGLLVALAYKPDLLLFDEPSSGLDPVVRRDMLTAIVRTITEEGRTIVLSSHLLDEVERVADQVVMIHEGQIVLSDTLEDIREAHHQLIVRFEQDQDQKPILPGMLSCEGGPMEWSCLCKEKIDILKTAVQNLKGNIVECTSPSLDEIFVARVKADTI